MKKADITQEQGVQGNLEYFCGEAGTAFEVANQEATARFMSVLRSRERKLEVVDLGAGDGAASNHLADECVRVVAVECNQYKIEKIDGRVELANRDMLEWLKEQPDDSVPNFFTHHALEHVVEVVQVLKEVARVLEPGGIFFAITPALDHLNHTHYICFDSVEELLPPGLQPIEMRQISREVMGDPKSPDPEYICIAQKDSK